VSENLTLTGAAGVAGLFWSLLYAREQRLPGLIISHVTWDIWIFLIAPTVPELRSGFSPPARSSDTAVTAR
jgi:membrane protease YdiL (CAAX protease family)